MESQPITKICHVTSVHQRNDTRIRKFCDTLMQAQYEVALLCMDNGGSEIEGGLQIVSADFQPKNKIQRIFKASNCLLREALKIDATIYHLHDPELLPLALKLKKHNKKVIYDSHEDFPVQVEDLFFIPKILKRLAGLFATTCMNYCIKKFDAIISVTPHIVEKLKKANSQTFLITNYPIISGEIEQSSLDEYCQRKNTLCYAGTIYEFSNQKYILDALNLPTLDIEYMLVGEINDEYKRILSALPSWDKVDFISSVPRSEVLKIYKKSTMAIVIFDYSRAVGDNMGTLGSNKMFEYMIAGLPIICTDFILWKEFVSRYNCGICVPPRDANAIANAIQYLVEHKEEAYQMGKNGQRAVLEEFNWATQAKKYLSIINSLENKKTNVCV